MQEKPIRLMIPGPIQPEADVLDAMSRPIVPHYGAAWSAYYLDTVELLKKVFNTEGDVFVLVGSGTSAIDACLGSAFASGEKIIVGINGFFGERIKIIAEWYGIQVVTVEEKWGKPFLVDDFEAALTQHPDAVGVAVTHLETSTTVVNPVEQIGPLARSHNACFFVDAVSSLGGMAYHMDDWCIDLCASSTQKCLGAPPGLAPVAVGKRGWEAIDRHPRKEQGFYTNLAVWRQYATEWAAWHPTPITMAVSNLTALRTSLDNLLKEGIENRLERYRLLAVRLRNGLRSIGYEPFTPDKEMSPVLTAAVPPDGVSVPDLIEYLAEEHRIMIAPGLGELMGKIFRIGHMSPVTTAEDIDATIGALAAFGKSGSGQTA